MGNPNFGDRRKWERLIRASAPPTGGHRAGPIPGTGEWQLAAEASGQEIQKYFQEPTSIGCSGSYGMIK